MLHRPAADANEDWRYENGGESRTHAHRRRHVLIALLLHALDAGAKRHLPFHRMLWMRAPNTISVAQFNRMREYAS